MSDLAGRQLNMLTGPEFQRMIARFGGLFTLGELADICGVATKHWPDSKGFPEPGWKVGQVRVFSGWEVFQWLWYGNKMVEANRLEKEIQGLKRRRFR